MMMEDDVAVVSRRNYIGRSIALCKRKENPIYPFMLVSCMLEHFNLAI